MKKIVFLAVCLLCSFSLSEVLAGVKIPHEFKSGEVAKASEVNENFTALKESIGQLEALLQKSITELETQINIIELFEKENQALKQNIDELKAKIDILGKRMSALIPPAASTSLPKPVAGQERHDPVSGIDFVWVPEGCFQMGSPDSESGRVSDEGPVHEVCLDGFWMGKYEITQAQWKRIMGNNPSSFQGDTNPVERVSWNDIQKFLQTLNNNAGKGMYRLPTEAEWEYAARAGTTTPFYFGNTISTDVANYDGNYTYGSGSKGIYREQTTEIGSFPPNAWGLYDMHGNVWEWCQDWYDSEYYSKSPRENPQGPSSGEFRVLRGGSWLLNPLVCRSADRVGYDPVGRDYHVFGFRVVVGSVAWTFQ